MINNAVKESNTVAKGDAVAMTIDTSNIEKQFIQAIDIYSDPKRFVTEIVSNAYDATVEEALRLGEDKEQFLRNNPILVSIETSKDGINLLKIRESRGIGISPERMKEIFSSLNATTKDTSAHFIGSKGKGRLALLTYSEIGYWNTCYDGKLYSYTLSRYQKKVNKFGVEELITHPSIAKTFEIPVDSDNYTEVVVPIKPGTGNVYTMMSYFKEHLIYFDNIVYHFENFPERAKELNDIELIHYDNFIVATPSVMTNPVVLLEKVPYSLKADLQSILPSGVAIKMGTSSLLVNESRENIIYNDVYKYEDSEGEEVIDISEAFEEGRLKEGYSRMQISVNFLIAEKLNLALAELQEMFEKQNSTTKSLWDFTFSDNNFKLKLKNDYFFEVSKERSKTSKRLFSFVDLHQDVREWIKEKIPNFEMSDQSLKLHLANTLKDVILEPEKFTLVIHRKSSQVKTQYLKSIGADDFVSICNKARKDWNEIRERFLEEAVAKASYVYESVEVPDEFIKEWKKVRLSKVDNVKTYSIMFGGSFEAKNVTARKLEEYADNYKTIYTVPKRGSYKKTILYNELRVNSTKVVEDMLEYGFVRISDSVRKALKNKAPEFYKKLVPIEVDTVKKHFDVDFIISCRLKELILEDYGFNTLVNFLKIYPKYDTKKTRALYTDHAKEITEILGIDQKISLSNNKKRLLDASEKLENSYRAYFSENCIETFRKLIITQV